MATYTDTSTLNTSPNDPLTSELATALKDNPIAIAEGAEGAPKVPGAAVQLFLGSVEAGQGQTTSVTITDITRVKTVIVHGAGRGQNANFSSATYQLSSNNGASFGSAVLVYSGDAPSVGGFAVVDMSASNAIRINVTGGEEAANFSRAYAVALQGVSP